MNSGSKAANLIPQSNCFAFRAALFHSTPVLERKRRHFWDCRSNSYSRRSKRLHGRQSLLRNVSAYADYLFQSWRDDFDEDDASSSRGPSWFRKQYSKGYRRNWTGSQGTRRACGGFQFCEDEIDIETMFRSAFGGNRYFYWSFINEENPQSKRSYSYSNYYERNWRHRFEHDSDSSPESNILESDFTSDCLALGLSASGPLKIQDVKNAYRACALKWHPDRHQGSAKAIAEEKFKLCSAAYQSLCDKLAPA